MSESGFQQQLEYHRHLRRSQLIIAAGVFLPEHSTRKQQQQQVQLTSAGYSELATFPIFIYLFIIQ